jgi:acetolactate synthase-1/2/3 large subunit
LSELKPLRKFGINKVCEEHISSTDVNQYVAYEIVSKNLKPNDNIVVDGGGNVLFSALQSLELPSNTRLITGAGIGCMGSGLPEAIGAYTANRNRTFCFIGDGSMQFNIQELQTIYHHQCNILVILFNNSGYLAIKNTQDSYFDRRFGVGCDSGLSFPDYSRVCAAYGLRYESIASKGDYEKLDELLVSDTSSPLVIEIHVPESTPLIPRGGFYKDGKGKNVRRPPWQLYPDLNYIPSYPGI